MLIRRAGQLSCLVLERQLARLRPKRKLSSDVEFLVWPERAIEFASDTDLLINATSVGLYPNAEAMPAVDFRTAPKGMLVCDAVFNPRETMLLAHAKAYGLQTLDVLSMLVYQGVIGFEMWTRQRAPEAVMLIREMAG